MTGNARGPFEVTLTPQPRDGQEEASLGRFILDKVFSGDLEAHSKGEMVAFRSDVQGSAGYVAMEQVRGTLKGRQGSFVLQHSGTMTRGAGGLTITVVPDSGTGELSGLTGTIEINIVDGKHFYTFEFEIIEEV